MLLPRVRLFEINDQPWFPHLLRSYVDAWLSLAWTFRFPFLQRSSPAELVATTLVRVLGRRGLRDCVVVDFASGSGGPTPVICKTVNAKVDGEVQDGGEKAQTMPVKFVMTDIRPPIHDLRHACAKDDNLSCIESSVDATSWQPGADLQDCKVFRMFSLAFHHFDDDLARRVLRNSLETSEGFGIFELQGRDASSLLTVSALGVLMLAISPIFFWRSPLHLFFTYVIPIPLFVLVFDGYISSLRTRTPDEIEDLIAECGANSSGWSFKSGSEIHTWPTGYMSWFIAQKD